MVKAPDSQASLLRDITRYCRCYWVYFIPISFLAYLMLESYQIDFRAFYLAGKSLLYGLDPYLNHVGNIPEFYGPVNAETAPVSGFRYPPPAALLFLPLGGLPYDIAKACFTLAMLLVLGVLGFHLVRRSHFQLPGEALLLMMVSFPVLALVERGQIDSLVMYLTVLSYWLLQNRRWRHLSPPLLALAAVIKLFPLIMVIYYAVRRRWSMVVATLAWLGALMVACWPVLGGSVYRHFWMRTLPEVFGPITTDQRIVLQGQGIALNRVVQSVDSIDLLATHDFVNGFMNPLLQKSTAGAILAGVILSGLMLVALQYCPPEQQAYSFFNVINLFNPVAWIMGLVWYLPLFLHLYPKVTPLGRGLLVLPLFLPPFLNANAVLAYLWGILFALAWRSRALRSALLLPSGVSESHA